MFTDNEDTITAIATPAGTGAISVIRVSGTKSISSVDKIFQGKTKLVNASSHTIHYGKIVSFLGKVIDDVLVLVFKSPNSFTGEDSIEISTHGSPYITERIINELLRQNIRQAEPGEFTKRAFLNGKLDLAQAEAVADVINSRTEASLRGARNQLDGILSKKVESLRKMLTNISSLVELGLDFAEEDIEFVSYDELNKKTDKIISEIDMLLDSYSFGRVIKDGVNVAIVGKPNVGKSSLLNYLLKESRAIVSEIPGTTRDIIREDVSIDGILFRLFDTAGIRTTESEIEKEGVLRSKEVIKNSDLVIFINDVIFGFDNDLYNEILGIVPKNRLIKTLNKIDLKGNHSGEYDVLISAKTGEGIRNLFSIMKKRAIGTKTYSEKSAIVSNTRHFNALDKAKESLLNAKESIQKKLSGEFIALDLRSTINFLDEIVGKITTEDVLNNIFSKFCIGK